MRAERSEVESTSVLQTFLSSFTIRRYETLSSRGNARYREITLRCLHGLGLGSLAVALFFDMGWWNVSLSTMGGYVLLRTGSVFLLFTLSCPRLGNRGD